MPYPSARFVCQMPLPDPKNRIFLVGCRAVVTGTNRLQASFHDATIYYPLAVKRVKQRTKNATFNYLFFDEGCFS